MTDLDAYRFKLYQEKVAILDNIAEIIYDKDLDEEEKVERIEIEIDKHF